jgi:MoaA/NifB/PqqE/SkfB family radical SAM enzyme
VDLLLTDACNLHCKYCPVSANMAAGRPTVFVDTAKAIRFLESVAHFRPAIRFFGGEPFLHPRWPRIFSAAVQNGLEIRAVTNGTRLLGRADELVQSRLLAIGISVDPPSAHDAFRGAGTFASCERVVGEIRRARERLGSSTPSIEIFTTVHEGTYAGLSRWAEQLRGWKIDMLRLQHQIWFSRSRQPASERLIAGAIGDAAFFGSDVETYCSDTAPKELVAFYRDPDFQRKTARACSLIWNYAFVDPVGRLYPCMTLDMGNVFDRPFEDVWNGSKFRAFRRLLRREQRLPLCERCPA